MSADEREIEREQQTFECPDCEHRAQKPEFEIDDEEDEDDQLSWARVVVLIVLLFVISSAFEYGVV